MNKKVIISLATVAMVAIVGSCVTFAASSHNYSKRETAQTTVPTATATQATTQAQTEKATQPITQAQTEKATQAQAPAQSKAEQATKAPALQQSEEHVAPKPTIPNVKGVWESKDHSDLFSLEIVNQSGNTIDIIIRCLNNSNASKLAIAKVTVTLDDISAGSSSVTGSGSFKYTDSFGNSGTGRIGVNESAISLVINEESNSGRGWGISHASGKYLPPYSE